MAGFRMHDPPPFADYLREPTWQTGLEWCAKVARGDFGDLEPQLLARYLGWLTGETRQLIDDLKELGVEFSED